jgi:DNA polymerase-3 subunit epsilon
MAGRRSTRSTLRVCIAILALSLVGISVLAASGGLRLSDGISLTLLALATSVGLGLAALWVMLTVMDHHFADLDRLRADILAVDPTAPALPPRWAEAGQGADEATRVAATAADFVGRIGDWMGEPDRRLAAVLSTIEDGFLVTTPTGLVSVANGAAREVLGAEHIAVGTSVFAALERDPFTVAVDNARSKGRPVSATLRLVDGTEIEARIAPLGPPGGAVLSFSAAAIEHHGTVDYNLGLHDEPPRPGTVDGATRMDDLPAVILDTETTGLDVTKDRIVSIGAVRMQGRVVYPHVAMDRLVNPGMPIPAPSVAVHGITDAMVADAPAMSDVHADVTLFVKGCVLIGHNIGFDRALLRAECERAGLPWADPLMLDTGHLMAALYPDMNDLSLDAIALRLGAEARGRHTALGDCLVTAEIFSKLVALLADRGVTTLDEVQALARTPKRLIGSQRAAGW